MIGAALGWKYNHAEGIETRDGAVTSWPDSLGPKPSGAELISIVGEYNDLISVISNLQKTEDLGTLARKLEEIIDFIDNDTPLSDTAKQWKNDRKTIRA